MKPAVLIFAISMLITTGCASSPEYIGASGYHQEYGDAHHSTIAPKGMYVHKLYPKPEVKDDTRGLKFFNHCDDVGKDYYSRVEYDCEFEKMDPLFY